MYTDLEFKLITNMKSVKIEGLENCPILDETTLCLTHPNAFEIERGKQELILNLLERAPLPVCFERKKW